MRGNAGGQREEVGGRRCVCGGGGGGGWKRDGFEGSTHEIMPEAESTQQLGNRMPSSSQSGLCEAKGWVWERERKEGASAI
jgi:hypothetical protein